MAHDVKLGQLLTGDEQRDAIHIAVAPVVAAEKLYPGQDIGFVGGDKTKVGKAENAIGIVDPFLKMPVQPDQGLWMFLYPQTVTGMRHEWAHPSFTDAPPTHTEQPTDKSESIAWLTDFASEFGITYEEVVAVGNQYLDRGEWFTCEGFDTPGRAFSDRQKFWMHFAAVTGRATDDEDAVPFSCSC